jgi:uncharacterized protein YihD (DUF1040 family)
MQSTPINQRPPERIPAILEALQTRWATCPDMRLSQLLVNLIQPKTRCPEIYYFEDDQLLQKLQSKETL